MNIYILRPCVNKKSDHHKVFGSAHIQSPAHSLLLKQWYQSQDLEWVVKKAGPKVWLKFRNNFLKKIKKECGSLTCGYCGSTDLVSNINVKGLPGNKKATIDHIIPLAQGGKKFDAKNLSVACLNCNKKKGTEIWEVKFPIKK